MTDFKIRDIRIFGDLKDAMLKVKSNIEPVLDSSSEALQLFLRDLQIDLKESESQLNDLKDKARAASDGNSPDKAAKAQHYGEEMSQMNHKIQALKSYIFTTQHLLMRFDLVKRKMGDMKQITSKGANALQSFEELGMRYLNITNLHRSGNNSNNTSGHSITSGDQLRLVGDTFHFSKQHSISQMDIQRLESEIRTGQKAGYKLSIDGVNQLDFSMLKSNGYKIQQIGPNDYTAYKTIY
jgi:hypothetical protein